MEIKIQGPHQLALRRRSVNVFDGAINVLTMRAPSDSGAGAGDGETGRTGAAARFYPRIGVRTSLGSYKISSNFCNARPRLFTIRMSGESTVQP
jgi:hypothetical protein